MQAIISHFIRVLRASGSVQQQLIRIRLLAIVALLTVGGVLPAAAQSMFSCKDDNGRVITSDRPIPECAKRPMRELNVYGVVTSEHSAPLTAEQLRQKRIDDEAQRIAALKRRQEQSRDKALLIAYPTMASLDSVRELQISDLRGEIAIVERRMAKDHLLLKSAQSEARGQTGLAGASARKRVEEIAASILADNDIVQRLRLDIDRTRQRFDEDAKRLKQLIRDPDSAEAEGNSRPLASR